VTESERHVSRSAADTEALGGRLGSRLSAGDVVMLEGELGVGKTTLIRGLADGLAGDPDQVSSPSFVIIQSYECGACGIGRLHHVDLYRLAERAADLRELGIEDVLSDPEAVTAIEWPKAALATWIPADARLWRVRITQGEGDAREILVVPPSPPEDLGTTS
jgi:tRNA threonylcarbamoyladenosine biosynthesis protein TsaE